MGLISWLFRKEIGPVGGFLVDTALGVADWATSGWGSLFEGGGSGSFGGSGLQVKIDASQLRRLEAQFPGRLQGAIESAMKKELYRLNQQYKGYASSQYRGTGGFSPTTIALRRYKAGYGPWLSRFSRYYVHPSILMGASGILDRSEAPGLGSAVPKRVASMARRHTRGGQIRIGRQQQKAIAAKLRKRHQAITERGQWGSHGGLGRYIPKLGVHRLRPRPIAEPVWHRERGHSIQNIRRNFIAKFNRR